MNVKKFLREQAEKNAENLLDENDLLFLQQFESVEEGAATAKPRVLSRKKLWAILSPVVTVAVAAIIIFPSVFVKRKGNIFYQEANVREMTSTFNDLQTDTKYFDFVENSDAPYRVMLNYDILSNDKLYYTLEGITVISKYKFHIIVNENYNYNANLSEELKIHYFSDYALNYEKVKINGADKVEATYNGYIQLNSEKVYIEYNQLIDLGEQAFFDDIESIIKVKS